MAGSHTKVDLLLELVGLESLSNTLMSSQYNVFRGEDGDPVIGATEGNATYQEWPGDEQEQLVSHEALSKLVSEV